MADERLPFRISAGLKDIIGKELITDDNIAIFELVKNSYDANAKNVKIIFQNLSKPSGSKDSKIIIADDGIGMSRDDLEKKWLFVGFSEKKFEIKGGKKVSSYRDKIKIKRAFAGAKGIGRFSADRLGRYMTLYSKKQKEQGVNMLSIDWKEFENVQDSDFQTILTDYSKISKLPKNVYAKSLTKGTILEISLLHEKWNREKLLKLKRYLQRLINPSSDQKNLDFTIEIISDEFKKSDKGKKYYDQVNGEVKNFVFEKLGIKTTQITCELNKDTVRTRIIDKGKLVVEFEENNTRNLLHDIKVTLFYLNPEAKRSFTTLMGVQPIRYGSVFLYRNGFRVYSYGDEGDDWLGLERRKTQGYARFLSAREMMGRIELLGEQDEFKELSSRSEGLLKNQSYFQLTDFFTNTVLKRFERYVVQGLNWDAGKIGIDETKERSAEEVLNIIGKKGLRNIRFGKNLLQVLNEQRSRQIPQIIKNFESLKKYIKSKKERKRVEKQVKALKSATMALSKEREEFKKKYELKKYESLFLDRALSSDKDQVINLVHSIKISSQAIDNSIYKINKKIKEGGKIQDVEKLFDRISIENQKINRISKIITSANFDLLSSTIEADLVQYIQQYLEIGSDVELDEIDVRFLNDETTFRTEFLPIDIAVIFDNFISNSSKADADLVTILFEKKGRNLRILVGDNGNGITEDDQKLLFNRGFSTRRKGSGLGLYYIKTMLESMGGNVKFLGNNIPEMGEGACFEVLIH